MPNPLTTPSRLAHRAQYEPAVVYSILDAALFCTVSYCQAGQPMAIPTAYARQADTLYIHGSVGSHFIRQIEGGAPVCISVMIADGLVLAKSAFAHSVNYRSVILFANARKIIDENERMTALALLTDHLVPNRWADLRPTTKREMQKTTVLAFSLREASAKIRTGGPNEEEADLDLPTWSGVIPLQTVRLTPLPADNSRGVPLPEYLRQPE